jgi:AcrR family transcriptional regulator
MTTDPLSSSALIQAAVRALPLVQERRGTAIRDTRGVATRLSAAAIDLFLARGFDDVTINEIAEAAGVNRRTFFRYFPSKETIVLDIHDQTNESLLHLIRGEQGASTDPSLVLSTLGAAVVAWCEEFEGLILGLSELAAESRLLFSATQHQSAIWEARIAEALRQRFIGLDSDIADLAGVVAMGCLRVARKRAPGSGRTYPREVEHLFASLQAINGNGPG